jgi:hypothetical protein
MSAIVEIIHVMLGISGVAFNPAQGSVVLELGMKYLCCIDHQSIDEAAHSQKPIHPIINDKKKNVIIPDIAGYLSWSLDPSQSLVSAVKLESVDFISCNNPSGGPSNHKIPHGIHKVFPNSDCSRMLCVHSKPVNVDFEETGVGLYSPKTDKYISSNLIHSEELSVSAVWNSNITSWIILDNYHKKIYMWGKDNNEASIIDPPKALADKTVIYTINEQGAFIVVGEEELGLIIRFWVGKADSTGVTWNQPLSIPPGSYETGAINSNGTKISVLDNTLKGHELIVFDVRSGKELERTPVPQKCIGQGIGWLSDSEVICVGNDDLLMLKLGGPSVQLIGNGVKHPK